MEQSLLDLFNELAQFKRNLINKLKEVYAAPFSFKSIGLFKEFFSFSKKEEVVVIEEKLSEQVIQRFRQNVSKSMIDFKEKIFKLDFREELTSENFELDGLCYDKLSTNVVLLIS